MDEAELRRRRNRRRLATKLGSLALILLAWQVYGRSVNPVLFTYPTAVAASAVRLAADGTLWHYGRQSLLVLFYGLSSAVVVGVPLGVAMARLDLVDWALEWPVNALYATPMVAVVPLIVLWFGFAVLAKVVVVFLFVIFPVLINTYHGVKAVDPKLVEVARSFCSSERRMWPDVVLPSAVPFIVTGVRLGVGRALVGMIIAEFYTSIAGLGYLIVRFADQFQTADLFVPVVMLALLGVALTAALNWFERRVAPWAHADD
jgi:ABC-type nitrate/sulfonate/bicarbonate transport system permease component